MLGKTKGAVSKAYQKFKINKFESAQYVLTCMKQTNDFVELKVATQVPRGADLDPQNENAGGDGQSPSRRGTGI